MANNWILEEQSIAFADAGEGGYVAVIDPPVYMLIPGEIYTVRWDGVNYPCVCQTVTIDSIIFDAVGNLSIQGGEDTGEPFVVESVAADGVAIFNALLAADTADSHTVGIVLGEMEEEPGILLMDHTGEQTNYGFPARLRVDTSDGGLQEYIIADDVPVLVEKTVTLDFSNGDTMEVVPADGNAFSKIVIPKPVYLQPGYIAEGFNIAGIIGALAASGGGGEIKTYATFSSASSNGQTLTVTHTLGVAPDIIFAYNQTASTGYPFMLTGCSTAFHAAYDWPPNLALIRPSSSTSALSTNSKVIGFDTDDSTLPLYNANENSVTVGGTGMSKGAWLFYFIGGLT